MASKGVPQFRAIDPASTPWVDQAVCRGRTELFFGRTSERPERRARRERIAAALCAGCPVQVECRDYARRNREYGFWGGEDERERHVAGFHLTAPIGLRGSKTA